MSRPPHGIRDFNRSDVTLTTNQNQDGADDQIGIGKADLVPQAYLAREVCDWEKAGLWVMNYAVGRPAITFVFDLLNRGPRSKSTGLGAPMGKLPHKRSWRNLVEI